MTYEDLVVLIPSHGLEDFPTELEEDQAASLLNGFAIIWHPLLLTAARVLPSWHRSDSPPEPLNKRLFVVPLPSETWVQGGWIDRARLEGAAVVSGLSKREEMLAAALAPLELDVPIDADLERIARRPPDLDALNDFYDAVGFGRLLRNQAERIADAA